MSELCSEKKSTERSFRNVLFLVLRLSDRAVSIIEFYIFGGFSFEVFFFLEVVNERFMEKRNLLFFLKLG